VIETVMVLRRAMDEASRITEIPYNGRAGRISLGFMGQAASLRRTGRLRIP